MFEKINACKICQDECEEGSEYCSDFCLDLGRLGKLIERIEAIEKTISSHHDISLIHTEKLRGLEQAITEMHLWNGDLLKLLGIRGDWRINPNYKWKFGGKKYKSEFVNFLDKKIDEENEKIKEQAEEPTLRIRTGQITGTAHTIEPSAKDDKDTEIRFNYIDPEKDCDLCKHFGHREYWDYMDNFRKALFCNLKGRDIDGTIPTAKDCNDFELKEKEPIPADDYGIIECSDKICEEMLNDARKELIAEFQNRVDKLSEEMDKTFEDSTDIYVKWQKILILLDKEKDYWEGQAKK